MALILEKSGYQVSFDFDQDMRVDATSESKNDRLCLLILDEDSTADKLVVLIRRLRYARQLCPIIVLYGHEAAKNIENFLSVGADGCLPISISPDGLVSALSLIVEEQIQFVAVNSKTELHLSSNPKTALSCVGQPRELGPVSDFSDQIFRISDNLNISCREHAVLQNLIRGDSNKIIARRLSISEATVKIHVRSLLRKIGAENRTQIAIWGLHENFGDVSKVAPVMNN